MKIAVTYENGKVFQHFGHSEKFKVYEIKNGKIIGSDVFDTNGSGHGALAYFLASLEVEVLICGGIGGGAKTALQSQGIKIYGGVTGDADEVVKGLLEGRLDYNPDVMCSHHGEGHECGSHDDHECGSHGNHECAGHDEGHECHCGSGCKH